MDTSLTHSKIIVTFLFLTGLVFGQPPSSFENTEITLSVNGVINIQAAPYFAKPDSLTDCTAAIRTAINAGSVIYIPRGAKPYLISDSLFLPDGKIIYGDGPQSIIKQTTRGAKGIWIGNNCVVRNFTLEGTATGNWEPGETAIYSTSRADWGRMDERYLTDADSLWKGKNAVIENMTIYGWGQTGISCGPYQKVRHNRVYNCFMEGIYIVGGFTEVTDNYVANTNSWGIDLNCSFALVQNNVLENVGNRDVLGTAIPYADDCGGICVMSDTRIWGMRGNIISGNIINTSTNSGISLHCQLYPLQQCTIEGNIIYNVGTTTPDNGCAGIYVANEDTSEDLMNNVIISHNNICKNTVGVGIRVYGTGGISIIGNKIDSVQTYGIFVLGSLSISTKKMSGGIIAENDINCVNVTNGICVGGMENISIIGNHVADTTATQDKYLIDFDSDKNYTFTDNVLRGDTAHVYGMNIRHGSSYGIVSHNTINNCRRGIYVDSSSTVGHLILTENGGTGTLDLPPEK